MSTWAWGIEEELQEYQLDKDVAAGRKLLAQAEAELPGYEGWASPRDSAS